MSKEPTSAEVDRRAWTDGDITVTPPDPARRNNAVKRILKRRGIVASAAVEAREGRFNRLARPARAVRRALGDDGLGRSFDALVASGELDHRDLLATAVERAHEYYGTPAVLASGEARSWARDLPDVEARDMLYHEAAAKFEEAQAQAIVASARLDLRKRVVRGRVRRG